MYATAGRISVPSGTYGATRSRCPTPFCTTTTALPGPHSRRSQPSALAVSCALVVSSTQSTGATSAGAVAIRTAAVRSSPPVSTVRVSRGLRTHTVTSRPAQWARAAR